MKVAWSIWNRVAIPYLVLPWTNLLKHIVQGPILLKGEFVSCHETNHDGEAWQMTSSNSEMRPAVLATSALDNVDKNEFEVWGWGWWGLDTCWGWEDGRYMSEAVSSTHIDVINLSSIEVGWWPPPGLNSELSLLVSINPNKFESLAVGRCFWINSS